MRSCRRSVCFLLPHGQQYTPRVGRALDPLDGVHFGPRCINRLVSQSHGWSAQCTSEGITPGLALRVVTVPASDPERIGPASTTRNKQFYNLESDVDAEMSPSSASEEDAQSATHVGGLGGDLPSYQSSTSFQT
ncbi:hypothetical protein AVEN_272707-1 [Araneus ventricosus]|uniref:Uncharacterized protein n=1 Tax=Araneus ventricosus TaxID=182803 RepID=A0A4Y2LBB9_ARAVE|nr:hypothetical protein AVEN_272707-1 [Araneus ventricosus]